MFVGGLDSACFEHEVLRGVSLSRAWQIAPGRALGTASGALTKAVVFVAYAAPLVMAGLAYEMLRYLVQYRGEVHVADLYELEARLFSVPTAAGPRALSDVIAQHQTPLLDVICGATYLVFLLEVIFMAVLLFFRARPKMLELTLGFLAVNLAGWVVWFLYPAAPPWYVDDFGLGPAVLNAPSSAAGLARLDTLLHTPIAATFYAKSANVFGAMPSLHVAYATLVAFVVMPLGGRLAAFALAFAVSMAFSAVYLRHHYVLDVVAGVALTLVVAPLLRRLLHMLVPAPGAATAPGPGGLESSPFEAKPGGVA
jgi:membrane-associated phospholipid phosphatase